MIHQKKEEEDLRKTAWSICHIINSCGNLKEPIGIDDLIGKKIKIKSKSEKERDYKEVKEKFKNIGV